MCKCNNLHPNMLSTVLCALKNEFPNYNWRAEKVMYNIKKAMPITQWLDVNQHGSFFFGNLIVELSANEKLTLSQNGIIKTLENGTFESKDLLFSELLTYTNDVLDHSVNFVFYGWYIYAEGTTSEQPTNLKSFYVSDATGDACNYPDLSPYNRQLWHNGANDMPQYGDIIYNDSQGTSLATQFAGNDNAQFPNLDYLKTDGLTAEMLEVVCK